MSHVQRLWALIVSGCQFAVEWVADQARDIAFYSRLAEDKGLPGLLAALSLWNRTRHLSEVYGYIEAELHMHEEQMTYLRAKLKEAQEAQRLARLGLDNLYREQA